MTSPASAETALPLEILLVDDEPSLREHLGEALRREGHHVSLAFDGRAALEAISHGSFDVVVSELHLPKADGLEVLREARKQVPARDVILINDQDHLEDAVSVLRCGATDYLVKPFKVEELLLRVERIARERRLKREREHGRPTSRGESDPSRLIGRSPVMHQLFDRIDKFGASDAPILITGESGTGKELVAHALHRRSARRDRPLVAVNCAAFPETLLEAELFGHERGAFTGAIRRREGRFKAADGGTLLLDEVAEIPLPAQAKLLRALQEKAFEPLGTNQTTHVDVRVISATHRNLKDLVARGLFRSDLYYRIKILEFELPSLRERRADIPMLVEHFLRRFSPGVEPAPITARAMAALVEHAFPGNVRELEHAIRHAVALTGGLEEIDLAHLPPEIAGKPAPGEPAKGGIQPLPSAMKAFEREYLRRALKAGGGSRSRTAHMLGISRKNLWEKLKRHQLVDWVEPEEDA